MMLLHNDEDEDGKILVKMVTKNAIFIFIIVQKLHFLKNENLDTKTLTSKRK